MVWKFVRGHGFLIPIFLAWSCVGFEDFDDCDELLVTHVVETDDGVEESETCDDIPLACFAIDDPCGDVSCLSALESICGVFVDEITCFDDGHSATGVECYTDETTPGF